MNKLNCPFCELVFEVPNNAFGGKGRCDRCEAKFIITRIMNKENILEPGRVIQEESPAQEVVEQDLALLEDDIEVQSSRKVSKKKVPRRKTKISLRTGSKAKEGTRQTRKSTPAREKKKACCFIYVHRDAGRSHSVLFLEGWR